MQYYLLNLYLGRVAFAALLDAACFIVAAAVTWFALSPPFGVQAYVGAAAAGALGSFVLLYYTDAYGLTVLGSGGRTLAAVLAALGVTSAAALAGQLIVGFPAGVWEPLAHGAGIYLPLLLAGRLGFRAVCGHSRLRQRVLLVGTSDLGQATARAVRARHNLGIDVVGFLSDDLTEQGGRVEGYSVLGRVHEIDKVIDRERVDRIVVASKRRDEFFPEEALLKAKLAGRRIESGVDFYERLTGRIYLRDLRPSYLIFSDGFREGRLAPVFRRTLDVAFSAFGLLIMSPILALCALAIRVDSPGPIFFGQDRVGKDGELFRVWKLRSMCDAAETDTGPVWSHSDDDRITRVGRLLRRARLDEFPQLWNVLKGDMSLVGPRPERPEFVEPLSERYPYFRYRSALRPGITGWAQIRFGYVNDVSGFEDKLALDLYYMKYRSVMMDLLILWKTLKTVVLLRGL